MTSFCIAVTGAIGSGKTTLSLLIKEAVGGQIVNVGDLIAQRLCEYGIGVPERTLLGHIFMQERGYSEYEGMLLEAAAPGVILDGVRVAAAVQALRRNTRLLHLHRTVTLQGVSQDSFENELPNLQSLADAVIPWCPSLLDLRTRFQAVLQTRLLQSKT